jgi:hypothetical protein
LANFIFICCGKAYAAVISLLHPYVLAQIGKSAEISCPRWRATNNTIMQWLRFYTNMEWFPHPLSAYKW